MGLLSKEPLSDTPTHLTGSAQNGLVQALSKAEMKSRSESAVASDWVELNHTNGSLLINHIYSLVLSFLHGVKEQPCPQRDVALFHTQNLAQFELFSSSYFLYP